MSFPIIMCHFQEWCISLRAIAELFCDFNDEREKENNNNNKIKKTSVS